MTKYNRNMPNAIRFIAPYIKRYKRQVIIALIFLGGATGATLAIPIAVREMLDAGISDIINGDVKTAIRELTQTFVWLFGLAVMLAGASAGRYYYVIWIGEKIVENIRYDTFKHITKLNAEFFDQNKTAELISHITNDTTVIKSAAGATASMALRNSLLMIGAVVAMVYTSTFLSVIVILALPIVIVPMLWLGRTVKRKTRVAQDELANASATALETIEGIKIVQAFGQEKVIVQKFKSNVEKTFNAARKSFLARAYLTFVAIITIFSAILIVAWIGIQEVVGGEMTAGTLGQFIIYSILAAGAIGSLSEVWGEMAQAAGATQRLADTMQHKNNVRTKKPKVNVKMPVKGKIVFENVKFAYPTRKDKIVLKGLSATINEGENVALVGASGAGKSTLFNLIMRQYNIDGGCITLDGQDIECIEPKKIREVIGLVPQENIMFAASVFDNIVFAKPEMEKSKVMEIAEMAQVNEFVEQMSHGYDTVIGEHGHNLSAGQRQRIMIARAMISEAPIMLLDEATSALDARNEELVQTALNNLTKGKTTITIAHRTSSIVNADRILVIENGEVVEEGSHDELTINSKTYKKITQKIR